MHISHSAGFVGNGTSLELTIVRGARQRRRNPVSFLGAESWQATLAVLIFIVPCALILTSHQMSDLFFKLDGNLAGGCRYGLPLSDPCRKTAV